MLPHTPTRSKRALHPANMERYFLKKGKENDTWSTFHKEYSLSLVQPAKITHTENLI